MNDLDFATAIVALIFIIVGLFTCWFGWKTKRQTLTILGVSLLVGAGLLVYIKSSQLREILTALASVTAVFIAAYSIDQTKQIRKDTINQEHREVNERRINLIIEWAIDVARNAFEPGIVELTSMTIEEMSAFVSRYEDELKHFRLARAKSLYMLNIAGRIDEDIRKTVEYLTDALKIDFIRELYSYKMTKGTKNEILVKDIAKRLQDNSEKVYALAADVIDKAAKCLPEIEKK